jgi:hypothetical protein
LEGINDRPYQQDDKVNTKEQEEREPDVLPLDFYPLLVPCLTKNLCGVIFKRSQIALGFHCLKSKGCTTNIDQEETTYSIDEPDLGKQRGEGGNKSQTE